MSWPVVAESYAVLAPQTLPLYRHHSQRAAIAGIRSEHALAEPDELWLCTTDTTAPMLDAVQRWWATLGEPCPLRIWQAEGSGDLADAPQVARMRELILRVTLLATECCGPQGQLVLSLAGGRKTMSADLQRAGQLFGCAAMLHIVGPGQLPAALREPAPELFASALPEALADYVRPVLLGQHRRSELLDVTLDDCSPVTAARFPLPAAEDREALMVTAAVLDTEALDRELNGRERAGAQLFGNFIRAIDEQAAHGNWRSLYRLPPRILQALRDTPLGPESREWLRRLPKAELHCHLGGMLDVPAQRAVARALWTQLSPAEHQRALRAVGSWIRSGEWPADWPKRLRDSPLRHACAAVLLIETDEVLLRQRLWGDHLPRVALKSRHPLGFAAYERPGELSGSALLQHPAAIEPYARAVLATARAQGLRYLELRGSPQKYLGGDAAAFLHRFHDALKQSLSTDELLCRFVVIIDRRQPDKAAVAVEQAVALADALPEFVAGLDLAGAEGTHNPEALARAFEPAFERCLPVTIHAGEGETAENIWQAAYRLHADRIGHGLTLADHPQLLQRFRDRGVCLELCPTSNREVVGFADPDEPASRDCLPYPLAALLAQGLRLTLCTDNPGISRTTLADEYLAAARMVHDRRQLTRWDALLLTRQAFKSAFVPAAERTRLMRAVDHELFQQLLAEAEPGWP